MDTTGSHATEQAAVPAGQPNIVLILADNLGWGELGCYGGGALRGAPTPRIDALAAQGTRCLNFNLESDCVPTRSALMTGRHPVRTGALQSVPAGLPQGLIPWEVTIAEALSGAGYATAMYGKWHLGDQEGRYPTDKGFDEWYGIPRTSNEIIHVADLFPTLARVAGAPMPVDRVIDGVDQLDFLLGASDKSAREGFVYYIKTEMGAAKWRDWKMHFVWEVEPNAGANHLETPYLFNLVQDPKEESDVNSTQGWVRGPIRRMILAFQDSLKKHPPIPPGAPDDHLPPRR